MQNVPDRLNNYLLTEIDPAFADRAWLIFQAVAHRQPARILEIGCGRGFYVNALAEFKTVKRIDGIEIEPAYLAQAQQTVTNKKVHLIEANAYALPYPDRSFDMVLLTEVLEHLTDEKQALREIKRVLKPGGWLVVTVPSSGFSFWWDPLNWLLMRCFKTHVNQHIWWLAGIWAGHQRLYSGSQLQQVLLKTGFAIEAQQGVTRFCWPATHFWLYGVGKNLVERCGWQSFSRFNLDQKKPLAQALAYCMSIPERLFGNWRPPLAKDGKLISVLRTDYTNHFIIVRS
jgi:ubiquinone/menaquinone biosynthesis C-methylase UbiE